MCTLVHFDQTLRRRWIFMDHSCRFLYVLLDPAISIIPFLRSNGVQESSTTLRIQSQQRSIDERDRRNCINFVRFKFIVSRFRNTVETIPISIIIQPLIYEFPLRETMIQNTRNIKHREIQDFSKFTWGNSRFIFCTRTYVRRSYQYL